jgi:TnpA family transposase
VLAAAAVPSRSKWKIKIPLTSKVRAYDLIRMISRDGNPTPLGQAFAEYGRVDKTLHLLAMVDPVDET